jgi:signal peptide peptidase SppA
MDLQNLKGRGISPETEQSMSTSKNTFPEVLWAGTEHSLALAMEAHDRMMAGAFSDDEEDDDEVPFNYSVQGDVGIIAIKGSLTNRDVWYNRYLGVTSYADIRKALMYAASSDVKAIVLDIDSGGGAVSGVADAGNLIKLIDQSVKPIYSFTDGAMCSAAYWLGCSAREVYSSNVSTVGSIGVIATHMEYSKALKEAGVGVTIVRAGEYKALANSLEPLSDKAKTQLQNQLNLAYQVFIEHVADCRKTTVNLCDANMAQGREFFGKEALAAGLVDGIETFDSMMSKVEMKLLDIEKHSNNNLGNYQRGIDMGKKALTETDIAALAAGVDLDAAADPVVEGNESTTEAASTEAEAVETTAEVTETEEKKHDNQASVVSFLQAQVKEKDTEILNLSIEVKGFKDKVASIEATHNGLTDVVRKAVAGMKVRMGASNVDLSALSAQELLADYAATSEVFLKTFKAGGVAAVDAASAEVQSPTMSPRQKARVDAARFTK